MGNLKVNIEKTGLKQKYIAEQLGIKPSLLSMVVNGHRHLSIDKERKLLDLLKQYAA